MERRGFVAAGLATAVALTGCDRAKGPGHGSTTSPAPSAPRIPPPTPSPPTPSPPTPSTSVAPGSVSAWAALEDTLDGDLLRRGQTGYRSSRLLYNPRFDAVRPVAVVRAASAQDVVEAIGFAREHQLGLVPRSGGHSYVGASTVAGGIQVDLTRLAEVSLDGELVHVGAGARLFDVHAALDRAARTVPTGTCPTVGATGLTLGGGVGVEARAYGLTCDSLMEVELVTADGRVRTVSEHRQSALFWALRGGGGGSYGVVTRLTFRTSPAHDAGFFFLHFDEKDAEQVVRGWLRRQQVSPRSSWSNVHLDAQRGGGIGLRIVGVSLTGDGHAEAAGLEQAIGVEPASATFAQHNHHDAVRLLAGCSTRTDASCHLTPAGSLQRQSFAAGSDVFDRRLGRTVGAVLAHVSRRGRAGGTGSLILDPLGGAVAEGAGAFPWRQAAGVAQWYVGLPLRPTPAAVASAYDWIRGGHRAFGAASLGGYVNYLEPGRAVGDYFGASYPQLRRVKSQVDPDDFFHTTWSVRPR